MFVFILIPTKRKHRLAEIYDLDKSRLIVNGYIICEDKVKASRDVMLQKGNCTRAYMHYFLKICSIQGNTYFPFLTPDINVYILEVVLVQIKAQFNLFCSIVVKSLLKRALLFLFNLTYTSCYLKYSVEHQLCINLLLKIVPKQCTVNFCLSNIC